MNDIQGYILDRWKSRMNAQQRTLVVYDPDGLYQEILQRAKDDGIEVIDTSTAPLTARLRAVNYWNDSLMSDPGARLIIYRRRPTPVDKREWIREPYAGFAQSAQLFPIPPRDDYFNICEQFLPTKSKELKDLFAAGNTAFNFINSLLDGNSYPALENLTGGHSIVEITKKLLSIETCENMNWLAEWTTLAAAHYPGLDAQATTLREVQRKLWTYLLFSEFVLDLPGALPDALATVARAPETMKEHIYLVCNDLRANHNMRDIYVREAASVTSNLNLPTHFARAKHLGERVTFNFENEVEFKRFIDYIKRNEIYAAEEMLNKNINDVWYQEDQNIAAFWNLAKQLIELIRHAENGFNIDCTLKEMVEWYAQEGCAVDEAFRTFLTLKFANSSSAPHEDELTDLLQTRYRSFAEHSVKAYQDKITEISNLPELANQVCKQKIYPALADGKRVAVVLVDALRYEVGSEFARKLARKYPDQVTCEARLSVLPSVTRFGMANHLDDIKLAVIDDELQPLISDKPIITVDDRIAYLKERVGVETQSIRLPDFTDGKVNDATRLLVILSTKIDSTCEQNDSNVSGVTAIPTEIKQLASAVDACRNLGFSEIYFAADHGFMILPDLRVSDKIDKPAGSNICLKESRCLVGNLNESGDTLTFTPDQLGIDGEFMKIAYAKNFTVFIKNKKYFHEGLSLQENVVPIVSVKFKEDEPRETFSVALRYKGSETGTVRNYRALLDVNVIFNNLFAEDINFKLVVQDTTGNKIGGPTESAFYDDATEIVHIPAGTTSFRQSIEIDEEFNGTEFVVRALDCNTNAQLAKIVLKFETII